mgnify:CR=1 FL=1
MRRPALALALAVALGATARAAEDPDAALLDAARACAAEDPQRAAELLRRVGYDGVAPGSVRAAAAQVALDALPFELGNRVAADIVLAVLRQNRAEPTAWRLAFDIRNRAIDGLDLDTGIEFLNGMIERYPDQLRFRYSLTDLLLDAGRPAEADAQCEQILRQVPNDARARFIQALLRELDGHADEAEQIYDEIVRTTGDPEAHVLKVRLLWDTLRRYDAAQRALAEARAAIEASPPGAERDRARARLDTEERLLRAELETQASLARAAGHLHAALAGIAVAWLVGLGGGLLWLRRRGAL